MRMQIRTPEDGHCGNSVAHWIKAPTSAGRCRGAVVCSSIRRLPSAAKSEPGPDPGIPAQSPHRMNGPQRTQNAQRESAPSRQRTQKATHGQGPPYKVGGLDPGDVARCETGSRLRESGGAGIRGLTDTAFVGPREAPSNRQKPTQVSSLRPSEACSEETQRVGTLKAPVGADERGSTR